MKTRESISDPEAIALSKVYAFLKRAARQRNVSQSQEDKKAELEGVPIEYTAETPQSGDFASVPSPVIE